MPNTENNYLGLIDTDMSDTDFFAIDEEEVVTDKGEETPEEVTPEGATDKKEDIVPEEDLFGGLEDDAGEDSEDEEESEEVVKPSMGSSASTLNFLKEKGFIDYELEEGEELTELKAEEILEDSIDNMFEERIEELFSEVPKIVKDMNTFVLKGGDINDFLKTITEQNVSGISLDMDLESEDNQIKIVKQGLEEQGFDEEYIKANIDFLKDSDRLKSTAKTHFDKWSETYKREQESILKSREEAQKEEKKRRRELKSSVVEYLQETESVDGFTISREDRIVLPDYMSDRAIKLDNGRQITGMQRDLMRVLGSSTGAVQMAKLLRTANEKGELNFEGIKRASETTVVKNVRDEIRRNKNNRIQSQSGSIKTKRLADYFK